MFLGGGGGGGFTQRTVLRVNEPKKKRARSAGGRSAAKPHYSFYNRVPSMEEESERKCISLTFHQMYESPSLSGSFLRYLTSRLVEWAVIHLPTLLPITKNQMERKVNLVLLTGREFGHIRFLKNRRLGKSALENLRIFS
jgi:hypothetical protein